MVFLVSVIKAVITGYVMEVQFLDDDDDDDDGTSHHHWRQDKLDNK